MRTIKKLVVHHSGSPRDTTTVDLIRKWHLDRGFSDIGYHFIVLGDGTLHRGRPLHEIGAHAKGANSDSIGICVVGDNTQPNQRWNHAQEDALLTVIDALEFLIPDIDVVGHRDVGMTKTECPGIDIKEWLKRML